MATLEMPIGKDSFSKLREDHNYYVDKTGLIQQILNKNAEVTLITRPRRFGKSLNMSMLDCFFDIRKNSKDLFEGLAISNEKEICEKWMNQYPTLYLSLKEIDGINYQQAYEQLKSILSSLCKRNLYLLESDLYDEVTRNKFCELYAGKSKEVSVTESLALLTEMLYEYYHKPVIVLIDEYDVPMSKGKSNGYYREMANIIRLMLSRALKGNSCLKFAVLTGCLRIAKESVFTGLNNLYVDSISDNRFDEYFGFTDSEIDKLLQDTNFTQSKTIMKEWYDGYHFGKVEVYCPWDVVNYVSQLQYNPEAKPKNYWANTSSNDIIRQFLSKNNTKINEQVSALLQGNTIQTKINENLTYEDLTDTEYNFWSVLYLTGYLTPVSVDGEKNEAELRIPNKEVKSIFENSIALWFAKDIVPTTLGDITSQLWNGDEKSLSRTFSNLLFKTISYHDYSELFYHAFITGIFVVSPYEVKSNRENGTGRTDVTVVDADNTRAAIFEFKVAENTKGLEAKCDEALKQIEDRQYAEELQEDRYIDVIACGVAFYKKKCMVKIKWY
ncbi:MAG: AAA family ATPase [Lachnospiraceae bacterium]|nr:AAA family ATPase [Lachnospiraceae bacterium]